MGPSQEATASLALQSLSTNAITAPPKSPAKKYQEAPKPAETKKPAAQAPSDSPSELHMTGLSRFKNDFDEATPLGKGGFGQVLRVRNKLDGRYYAIKRIKLNRSDMENNRRYMREVIALAQVHHDRVVRYYQAWIEGADKDAASIVNSEASGSEDEDDDDDDDDDDDEDEEEEDEEELSSKFGDLSMDWLGMLTDL